MATLMVSKDKSKTLPSGAGRYTIGVGWDPGKDANGTALTESPDLDLWVVRKRGTKGEAICWANSELHRPDLGFKTDPDTGEKNPFIATPELDVIHEGDDRTGKSSNGGYDEIVRLDLSKAPADVTAYEVLVAYFEEPDTNSGNTLGMASNIQCGVKDEAKGHEVKTEISDEFGWDLTARVCTIQKNDDGVWEILNNRKGFPERIFDILDQFGVSA